MKLELKLPIQNLMSDYPIQLTITEIKSLITFVSDMLEKDLWSKMEVFYPFGMNNIEMYPSKVNYAIGDTVCSKIEGTPIGKCTGFAHNDTCVVIDGKVFGGKFYFEKYDKL